MGKNKLVYGNRIRNVSCKDPSRPGQTIANEWPWPYGTAIALYSDENGIIANNLLPKADRHVKVKVDFRGHHGPDFSGKVSYPYDNRYGIEVNSLMTSPAMSACGKEGKCDCNPGTPQCRLTPDTFPWQFRRVCHGLRITC